MRPVITVAFAATPLLVSGCAYLTTYMSSVNLKDKSYVMDVKQRVVFSQKLPPGDASHHGVVS